MNKSRIFCFDTLYFDNKRIRRFISVLLMLCITLITSLLIHNSFSTKAAAPNVTSISPNNGPIAGGTVINITGSGFMGEYEQVEHINFDGNTYIQTDVTQRNNSVVKNMNVRIMPDAFDKARFVVGAANSSGQQIFAVSRSAANRYLFYASSGTPTPYPSGGTTALATIPATGMVDIAFDSVRSFHINGSMGGASGSNPSADSYYQIGGTSGHTNDTSKNYFKGKFYMMKLTDGVTGGLLNNFVPVHKIGTDIYGVVDLVTGKFYGSANDGAITGGAVVPGAPAPDRPISVTIDGRACTGVEVLSDTELTCHTPSGLGLGKKDVIVSNIVNPSETTTVADGFEYALRLNSVTPKYGEPQETTEIEIEGGVFSTPPDSYVSASDSGVQFDGESWIATGFDQIGSTSYATEFKLTSSATYNTGFMGSRSTGGSGSLLVWQLATGNFRFDYGTSSGSSQSYAGLINVRTNVLIDDGYVKINGIKNNDRAKIDFSNELPAEMLLGSLTTGSGYGTNGFSAYNNYKGIMYSAQICKEKSIAIEKGVIYQESSICDGPPDSANNSSRPERVLVRDLRASKRISDGVCGFYDMVTGEFLTNAGYGTLTCAADDTSSNILEVPVELEVVYKGTETVDNVEVEQTGVCSNPVLLSSTKIKCTMPTSIFTENDGSGRVDLTVYANGVEATPGTEDADDFYYGSPMVVETISPNRGSINGNQVVTITGNNFYPDLDPTSHDPTTSWQDISVTIWNSSGNSPCVIQNVSDYSNTSIECTTSPNNGGISNITINNGLEEYTYRGSIDPITGAITSGYLYEDDLISISPNESPTSGGEVVTILGHNFLTSGSTTKVYFGGVLSPSVTVLDSNTIQATAPAHAPGIVDVLVSQDGYAASLDRQAVGAFEYIVNRSNISLSPNQGYSSGGDVVVINGSFDTNTSAEVTFDDIPATNIEVLSSTQIRLTTPAHSAGRINVVVKQYGATVGESINGFTYISPLTIDSLSPDRGSIDGGTIVTISGQSFIPIGQTAETAFPNLSVTIGGVPCVVAKISDYTNTTIKCTTGSHVAGRVDVVVTAGSGDNKTSTLPNGFLYILSELSLSSQSVNINLNAVSSEVGANHTSVYVQTDNPEGYSAKMRADDSDGSTSNDNWLKCNTVGLTAKFETISAAGELLDNTWGWNIFPSQPTTWKPVTTTNSSIAESSSPSGSSSDGQEADEHKLWFGAKANLTQPACTYSAILVISATVNI